MDSALGRVRRVRDAAEDRVAVLASRYRRFSEPVLRISVGVVFVWFGALKFLPGMSPAQDLAVRCMQVLSLGLVPADVTRPMLALMEVGIGLLLIGGWWLRTVLVVFLVHMAGVFATLAIAPDAVWVNGSPLQLTLEGQYIVKNIVLVTAMLTVAAARVGARQPTRTPAPSPAPAHLSVPASLPTPAPVTVAPAPLPPAQREPAAG